MRLRFLDFKRLLRAGAGVISASPSAPGTLEPWISIETFPFCAGSTAVKLVSKDKPCTSGAVPSRRRMLRAKLEGKD